jgi:hypothetical protein
MFINTTGIGKREQAQLEEAARFFAACLMDPRMVRNINLDLEVRKNLDVQGECVDEEGTRNPRWFTIGLRKQNLQEMIKTLAHEMVHVKQHAKNELQNGIMIPTKGGLRMTSRWMGKIWKPKRNEDHYFDSPWEVDAYGREVGLYQKWIKHCQK